MWGSKRKGHYPLAYNCRYWIGDQSGSRFDDVCKICLQEEA